MKYQSGVVVLGAPVSDADVRVLVALTTDLVGKLNADPRVSGILVLRPLPSHVDVRLMGHLSGPAAAVAALNQFLEPFVQAEFDRARREGRHERRPFPLEPGVQRVRPQEPQTEPAERYRDEEVLLAPGFDHPDFLV